MFHEISASRRPLMCTWRLFLRRRLELLASIQAAPVHFYTEDLIQHGLPSVLWLDLHYVSDASCWLNLHCYAVCMHWGEKYWPHGETVGFYWWSKKNKNISLYLCTHAHTLIMIWAIRDISPVCRWLCGAGRAPCMPLLFCPCHLQGALWDMTNGVLCLKDCGVWCECSLGRGEVNYLGLNSYFVPLRGSGRQTGEDSDASWTGCISRSPRRKQQLFFFFISLLCVSLISTYGLRASLVPPEP